MRYDIDQRCAYPFIRVEDAGIAPKNPATQTPALEQNISIAFVRGWSKYLERNSQAICGHGSTMFAAIGIGTFGQCYTLNLL